MIVAIGHLLRYSPALNNATRSADGRIEIVEIRQEVCCQEGGSQEGGYEEACNQAGSSKEGSGKAHCHKDRCQKSSCEEGNREKGSGEKSSCEKSAGEKSSCEKGAVKQAVVKKAAVKKTVATKTAAKKAAVKKTVATKTAAKKAAVKKAAVKKTVATKTAAKKAAVKKTAVKKTVAKQAVVKKAAVKKTVATKTAAKKSAAKKTVDAAVPRPQQVVPPKLAPRIKEKKSSFPSLLSNDVPEVVEVPKPRGTSKDGIAYTKDFDVKFLSAQKDELLARRARELTRATRLEEEAISLIEDGEMGDVQFDDEGGEGDTMVVQRDLDRLLSGQARQTIGDIDEALARIQVGTYGYSVVSGKPIPRERLEAIPETTVLAVEKVSGAGFR